MFLSLRADQGIHPATKGMQKTDLGHQHSRNLHNSGWRCVCGGPWCGQAEELQPRHRHGNPCNHSHLQVSFSLCLIHPRTPAQGKLLETWTRVGHCSEDACTCGRPCCGQAEQLQVAQLAWSPLQLQLSPGHPHSPRTMFTWQGFVERSANCPGLHTLRRFGGDPLAEVLPEVCWTYLNKEAPLQANSEQRTKLECS